MFYPRLKELRKRNDKGQKEIAALLNIDQRVYSTYETGKREIPSRFLLILADYYNCSVDYIMGRTQNKNTDKK